MLCLHVCQQARRTHPRSPRNRIKNSSIYPLLGAVYHFTSTGEILENLGDIEFLANFLKICCSRPASICLPAGQTCARAISKKSNKKFKNLPPPRCGLLLYIDQRNFGEFGAILNFWRFFLKFFAVGLRVYAMFTCLPAGQTYARAVS